MNLKDEYIWSADEWLYLRESCKIVPTLNGCIPSLPRQEEFSGLPATLLREERMVLKYCDVKSETQLMKTETSKVYNDSKVNSASKYFDEDLYMRNQHEVEKQGHGNESFESSGVRSLNSYSLIKCEVFIDLHKKGYYITCGSKFGGDFLAYPNDPVKFHSHYIVICLPWTAMFPALKLITFGRISSATKKTILLSTLSPEKEVVYQSLYWKNEGNGEIGE